MDHPYKSQPDHAFWRKAIADLPYHDVDPVVEAAFLLTATDRIATAGSCFAQHISRHLVAHGFNFYVTEDAHPLIRETVTADYNYGTYTARYGNLYTSRQLLQLFQRAYNEATPLDDCWTRPDGRLVDPFRPQIQPGGYHSVEELHADRAHHLACVRRAFETLDVLVFTLGLTETWYRREDDFVFPLCPGVSGGEFDAGRYGLMNLSVADVVGDMAAFLAGLRRVNPHCKVLLTVSPVPLIATAEPRHVLVSTTYSKSVLRAACGELVQKFADVAYFPSYEVIVGSFNRGRYFAADLRGVTEEGVTHVMRLFSRHYLAAAPAPPAAVPTPPAEEADLQAAVEVLCDEEAIEGSVASAPARSA